MKCIVVTSMSVCLCVCPSPHCHDTARNLGEWQGCLQSCTIGRICSRCTGFVAMTTYTYVSLQPYTLKNAEREMSASDMPGFISIANNGVHICIYCRSVRVAWQTRTRSKRSMLNSSHKAVRNHLLANTGRLVFCFVGLVDIQRARVHLTTYSLNLSVTLNPRFAASLEKLINLSSIKAYVPHTQAIAET